MQGKIFIATFTLVLISLEVLIAGAWTGWMQKQVDLIPLVGIGATLCFLVRSLFDGLSFIRGIATVSGGFVISVVAVAVATIILQNGFPKALGLPLSFMIAYVLFTVFGIILLLIGFRAKPNEA